MPRLFIALPIGEDIRRMLDPVYEFFKSQDHILKVVIPANFHITIKFLGECSTSVATAIESTFDEIHTPRDEIPFKLTGLGAFPNTRKPSVVWAGIDTDAEFVDHLYKNVEIYTRNFNFKEEPRDLTLHLTLARVKKGRSITGDFLKFIESNRETAFGDSVFDRLSLFSSRLNPEGPVYTELKAIKFR